VDRLGIPGVGAEIKFGQSIGAVAVRIERSVSGVGRIESIEAFPKVGKSICVRIRRRFGANLNRARIRGEASNARQAAGVNHHIAGTTGVNSGAVRQWHQRNCRPAIVLEHAEARGPTDDISAAINPLANQTRGVR
jgi:hypothetical protein